MAKVVLLLGPLDATCVANSCPGAGATERTAIMLGGAGRCWLEIKLVRNNNSKSTNNTTTTTAAATTTTTTTIITRAIIIIKSV